MIGSEDDFFVIDIRVDKSLTESIQFDDLPLAIKKYLRVISVE